MFEFIILLSVIIAAFTTLFAFIPALFENGKFRHHLPLLCGLVIVAFFLVANPQQEPGSLYWQKVWCQYLLLPLFMYAPLPYLEKWKGTVLSKFSVFFGAGVTANFYFAFLIYGNYYLEEFWQVDGLFWTAGTFILAFVIYYGLYRGELFISQTPEEKPSKTEPENETRAPSSETRKNIVLMVGLLVFCVPSLLIVSLGNTESCGGFEVYPIDQSQLFPSTVLHLTDNDFRNFSRMASIIRDGKTISGGCMSSRYDPDTCVGKRSFRCNEEQQFVQYKEKYLEYKGRYYIIVQSYVV